ncbi:hypothetical protein AAHA92_21849 [Salvia divinorum]|uniref:Secreted protein n=1 Tax=Salvia divinorum TaxID=28513 RepID=A0ABD1GLS2_SALDI
MPYRPVGQELLTLLPSSCLLAVAPSRISLVAVREEERRSRCRPAPTGGVRLPVVAASVNVVRQPRSTARWLAKSPMASPPSYSRISRRVAVPNRQPRCPNKGIGSARRGDRIDPKSIYI